MIVCTTFLELSLGCLLILLHSAAMLSSCPAVRGDHLPQVAAVQLRALFCEEVSSGTWSVFHTRPIERSFLFTEWAVLWLSHRGEKVMRWQLFDKQANNERHRRNIRFVCLKFIWLTTADSEEKEAVPFLRLQIQMWLRLHNNAIEARQTFHSTMYLFLSKHSENWNNFANWWLHHYFKYTFKYRIL